MQPPIDSVTKKSIMTSSGLLYIVIIIVILVGISIYVTNNSIQKPTLEDKLSQLKELRADKVNHQKAIYIDDQKIVPLKCSIYSDVGAKDQWNIECQDYFQEQQAKIKDTSTSISKDNISDE